MPVVWGQQLRVIDQETNTPLEGVALFSDDRTKSTLTDAQGQADLRGFEGELKINLQLNGFQPAKLTSLSGVWETQNFYMVPATEMLQEVILSVARNETRRDQLAEKVSLITAEALEKTPLRTGADILELSPGVRVQKSQGGGGSPVLRGFEANRVLLVVDGVRMNNAIYRSGHLQNAITLDPNILERVEVVFGSSSVGYGSDALGGVIHYYTKTPKLNAEKPFEGNFSSAYNSANQGSMNNFTAQVSKEKWGSISSLSFSKFGDIRMGTHRTHGYADWGLTPYFSENKRSYYKETATRNPDPEIQKNTGYDQYDFFQKFLYQINTQSQLTLNVQYSTSSDIDRYDKLSEGDQDDLKFSEWYYGPQNRFLAAAQYKAFKDRKWLRKGTLTLAYQNIVESRNKRKFGSLQRDTQEEQVNVLSLNADFDALPAEKINVAYGFEGTYNWVYSRGFSRVLSVQGNQIVGSDWPLAIPSRYPSKGSSMGSLALYANGVWDYTPKLTLNAGLRLTLSSLDAEWKKTALIDPLLTKVTLRSEALTWTLATIYKPKPGWQLNFILSNGFKAPNIDDIGKIRENAGVLVVPNSFLKPEYAYNFDIGLMRMGQNQKNQLSARGFATMISRHIVRSDYIVFSDNTTPSLATILYDGEELPTVANKNLGNRWVYGSSIDGKYSFTPALTARANLMYTLGNKNEKYGPLPSIAPYFGSISLQYEKTRWSFRADYQFSGAKDPDEYSYGGEDGLEETPLLNPTSDIPRYAGSPAWNRAAVFANYAPRPDMTFQFGLDNIFDTHYRSFASGVSAPGRSLQLGLRLKF